ncbi:MAG: TonB-dependent receptor [Acidobacteria bacterium]|nr:TonB-dependent receptor [Acidobacteriota bacterium]
MPAVGAAGQDRPVTTGRVAATVTALEGTVHLPGVQVELRETEGATVLARTTTDGAGRVTFPDVPPGRYIVSVSGAGFLERDSPPFTVRAGETSQVLLDTRLTFAPLDVEVRADAPKTTDSVQPVSMSDMLSGRLFETAPLQGDDFRSLLPLLPGVVRDNNGRLRIRGGQPTQGALQVSSASLIDPSTGDFDLDLPAQAIESIEVLANPFAAEYGRFTTSVTHIRTRGGTNEWDFSAGHLMPRLRGLRGIRGFEPRFSARGPLRKDRVFFAQDVQFRYVATPVKSLPDEPEIDLRSFDSFTRFDAVVSPRHMLGGALIMFPREVRHVTMDTFRPKETAPDLTQEGFSVGLVDRFAILPDLVAETTLSIRRFEIEVASDERAPMIYAPETQGGGFFNDQERNVTSFQWVQALTLSRDLWRGQHVVKFGADVQHSGYSGASLSRPVEIRRVDGSLAERIDFGPPSTQSVAGVEVALFAQDRWRVNDRLTFEAGLRVDRDAVVEGVNWSPRAGASFSVLPDGRGILRGGFGKFIQRTPLNIDAFTQFEPRTVTRFAADLTALGNPVTLVHQRPNRLRTPEANVGNIEWDQRFGRRFLLKLSFLARHGTHELIVLPDAKAGALRLSNDGESRYREVESTVRYIGGPRRDLTLSYVWARGTADLNAYDQFFGNFRSPIIRPNEHSLTPTDVRHRLLLRGLVGLPGRWDLSPVLELRSGFPWSAVDEFQDFVGPRNRTGRMPAVRTLDFSLVRPWQIGKYRFRAGVRVFNAFGDTGHRDVQTNIASQVFGTPFNPIERSIGIMFGAGR